APERQHMGARGGRREPGHTRRAGPRVFDKAVGDRELPVSLEIEAEVDIHARSGSDARAVRDPMGDPVVDDDVVSVAPGDEVPGERDVATAPARNGSLPDHERSLRTSDVAHDDAQLLTVAVELDVRRDATVERER